jgi:hypothetical protein
MAAFLKLAIRSACVLPLTSKNWISVFEMGGGVQIAGDPNHISRRTAWAAPPGGTNVRPCRLKLAAHGALVAQADKHPIAMTPTTNRRRNWAIS